MREASVNSESVQDDVTPMWSRYDTLSHKYTAIFLTVIDALMGIGLAAIWVIHWTRISDHPAEDRFFVLSLAIVAPLLIPLAALTAWRITKGLNSSTKVRTEIRWAVWCAISAILSSCYTLMLLMTSVGSMTR
jgi:hypothetical protein